MYYLETNSLRTLLPKLQENEFRNNSFTSILSIFELITGIKTPKEFEIRKNILEKIANSDIAIDFEHTEDRFLRSFGIKAIPDQKQFLTKTICTILKVDSFNDIDSAFEKVGLLEYLNHFKKVDSYGHELLKNSFQGKTREFRNTYSNGIEMHLTRWDKDYNEKQIELFLKPIIRLYATNISKNLELNTQGLSVDDLISTYDGSCNKYFTASSYYSELRVVFGTEPGANDFFDISHISYIEDERNILITDDKLIHRVCSKLFPNQILRTKDV